MIKQAHALIRPAQDQFRLAVSARFLARRLCRQTGDIIRGRNTVIQNESRIPGLRDYAIRSRHRVQELRIGDQAIVVRRRFHRIERRPVSIII